uniref:Uncharacterized protein n=1 Tax=Solibacter usitatus (strain Ellin6076) TaxID=234267 RepID=Q01Y11_SOLUE
MTKLKQFDPNRSAPKSQYLKSGIHTEYAVLSPAERASLESLIAAYYARFRPTCPEERVYIDDVIHCEWILLRLRRAEAEINSFVHESCFQPDEDFPLGQPAALEPKAFSSLQWRINATRKARNEALAALREFRQQPIPAA